MIEVVEAHFNTSAANISQSPDNDTVNEIAFMARSNAGKSSLLNALCNHKNLAKVSATPGKTRLINYFDATFMDRDNHEKLNALLVDLPGFGYAKVSKSLKSDWEKNLTDFITQREQIRVFVHLVDARHPDLPIDRSVADYLEQIRRPGQTVLRVFTKSDKLNQKELGALLRDYPGALIVSSSKKRGITKLAARLYDLLTGTDDVHPL
ncbi:ribosome biogenesis GTP-binding protein YihA/YsxC [Sulfurimonas sp. HSL1-2]|uniref:ribosome biogenesis GTP-binding protein YihA/YsxC n=1 Tax=Thiomicrolovo zhangzhouensis TaxID=3131933 RepID=UPI0031F8CCD6